MEPTTSTEGEQGPQVSAEDAVLRRARELSARKKLTPFSLKRLLESIPDDWRPDEGDVDDFLNSIRGRSGPA